MSLIKKPKSTEARRRASRRNAQSSTGPHAAGRQRLRALKYRHGNFVLVEEMALDMLGEDAQGLHRLRLKLEQVWSPTDGTQAELVDGLARALWLMKRYDRMREGHALRLAQQANRGREANLHARMMQLKMDSALLSTLALPVAREHYVTTPEDLKMMHDAHRNGLMGDLGDIALAFFYRLQPPGAPGPGESTAEGELPPDDEATPELDRQKCQRVMNRIRGIFNLPPLPDEAPGESNDPRSVCARGDAAFDQGQEGMPSSDQEGAGTCAAVSDAGTAASGADEPDSSLIPDPDYPEITPEEWNSREMIRELLHNLLERQAQILEKERMVQLREGLMGPTPFERAAEISPVHENAVEERRIEDRNFRQVWKLTELLMKMKRQEKMLQKNLGETPETVEKKR